MDRKRRTGLLVVIGLIVASAMWVLNPFGSPEPIQEAALPEANESVNQQMAIETAPLPVQAPAPIEAPLPAEPVAIAPVQAEVVQAPVELPEPIRVQPYIRFYSSTENYDYQNNEISWRKYREYRRQFAKGISVA